MSCGLMWVVISSGMVIDIHRSSLNQLKICVQLTECKLYLNWKGEKRIKVLNILLKGMLITGKTSSKKRQKRATIRIELRKKKFTFYFMKFCEICILFNCGFLWYTIFLNFIKLPFCFINILHYVVFILWFYHLSYYAIVC